MKLENSRKSLKIVKFITFKIQLQINPNFFHLIWNLIIYHCKNSNYLNNKSDARPTGWIGPALMSSKGKLGMEELRVLNDVMLSKISSSSQPSGASSQCSWDAPSRMERKSSRIRRRGRENSLEPSGKARSSTRRPGPRSQSRTLTSLSLTRSEGGGDKCGKYWRKYRTSK